MRLSTVTSFGSTDVARCQAKSKRSGVLCRKAAMRDKKVCRTHGGTSTGPKTTAGRQRFAAANSAWARDQSNTCSERCQTSWASWNGADPKECRFDNLIPVFWSVARNIPFIFAKFKFLAHIRIMYDQDYLLDLGGTPRVGLGNEKLDGQQGSLKRVFRL